MDGGAPAIKGGKGAGSKFGSCCEERRDLLRLQRRERTEDEILVHTNMAVKATRTTAKYIIPTVGYLMISDDRSNLQSNKQPPQQNTNPLV